MAHTDLAPFPLAAESVLFATIYKESKSHRLLDDEHREMGNCLPCRRGKDQKAQTELNHLSLLQTSSSGKDDASSEPEKSVSVENVQLVYTFVF